MVRARISTGVGLTTALLLLAGVATAAPLALFEGGGEAAGEAQAGYHADATGAIDEAARAATDAQAQAVGAWKGANEGYEGAREEIVRAIDSADAPAAPSCACDDVFDQLEQVGNVQASHADAVEKAADLETGYVDAGADVSAAGEVKGWFSNLFDGARSVFDSLQGMMGVDTSAANDAKSSAKQLLYADDDLRDQVTDLLAEEHQLPSVDPRLDGSLGAGHASEVTSSALGSIQGSTP